MEISRDTESVEQNPNIILCKNIEQILYRIKLSQARQW